MKTVLGLLLGLRRHDLRAARTFIDTMFPGVSLPVRFVRFLVWALGQIFFTIPRALSSVRFARPVSRTPIWLAAGNPLANHPWGNDPNTSLPTDADVVVIGAGFTGAGCAYHWAKAGQGRMLVLEMEDAASGASGRNEGLVVMGRYFAMVRDTVRPYLDKVRADLSCEDRNALAEQFAARYSQSAYKNADLVETTVRAEGYDCDYARNGWIQTRDESGQQALAESIQAGAIAGFDDWTSLSPAEVLEKGGMRVEHSAGFSRRAASFHPAKWVWSLLQTAIATPHVDLYSRTKVLNITDQGEDYTIETSRGTIRCRHIINATESYTAILHAQFRDKLNPVQTQAAFGRGGPHNMGKHIGLSGKRGFFGRHDTGVMIGSDATQLPYHLAGNNNPSRFISKFLIGEMHRYFGRSPIEITHEWSGTPGFTADEFPVVGLIDDKRQYLIGGMCGSGTAVSFNGARHVVQQILGIDGPDDYPAAYYAPTRILDPDNHPWPEIERP
ncbi:MAG: FAD-binding oxidoreductase [Gemmatimonadetes bacterium]|nr:FAD-binding oxidoreductase [Gemmatimonadota bacterium]